MEGAIKLSRVGSILTNKFLEHLPLTIKNIIDKKQFKKMNKQVIKDMLLDKLKFRKSKIFYYAFSKKEIEENRFSYTKNKRANEIKKR